MVEVGPAGAIGLAALGLIVPPLRRRVFAVARATGRGGILIVGGVATAVTDVASAAIRGEVVAARPGSRDAQAGPKQQ